MHFRVVLMLLAAVAASAQTVGANLQGVVSDQSSAVVPNAAVEVVNVGTGARHSLVADEDGRWRAPALQPGEYEIRATATGFQTTVRQSVHLEVGQDAVVDLRMEVGAITSEVKVEGEAPLVNLVNGSVSGLVDQKQMRDLPLNGRSFQQLALLQPGVNAVTAGGNDPVGGRTPKIAINGMRPELSSFLLDGTDINDVYNKTPGSVGGVLLGVEAVLEFQVLTNSYSAAPPAASSTPSRAPAPTATMAPRSSFCATRRSTPRTSSIWPPTPSRPSSAISLARSWAAPFARTRPSSSARSNRSSSG